VERPLGAGAAAVLSERAAAGGASERPLVGRGGRAAVSRAGAAAGLSERAAAGGASERLLVEQVSGRWVERASGR
jgi:hypothetical protein